MKEKKIEIIRAVDEQDIVTDLFAIDAGERPNFGVTTRAVYDFLGDYQVEDDEELYRELIDSICNRKSASLYSYTFFFVDVTLYTK